MDSVPSLRTSPVKAFYWLRHPHVLPAHRHRLQFLLPMIATVSPTGPSTLWENVLKSLSCHKRFIWIASNLEREHTCYSGTLWVMRKCCDLCIFCAHEEYIMNILLPLDRSLWDFETNMKILNQLYYTKTLSSDVLQLSLSLMKLVKYHHSESFT